MKQTDFLIRAEHTSGYTEQNLVEMLKRAGFLGFKVTVLDTEDAGDSNDPRNYSPYIGH